MSDINLIPEKRRIRKRYQRKLRLWLRISGIYIACLGCMLGSAYAMWAGDDAVLNKKLDSTEARIERTQDSLIKLRKQLALCRSQLHTNQVIRHQPDWSRLLLLIAEAMGEEVTLKSARLITLNKQQQNVVDQFRSNTESNSTDSLLTERDYHLQFTGFSRTQTAVSLFVLRLERLELFTSVRLDKSRRQAFLDEPAVAFTIDCGI